MRKAKKIVSAVLSVLMVTSAFSALTFSASAAETTEENKITVTSNVTNPVSYDYNENSEQFTVTYKLQSNLKLINNQAYFTYDSTKLKLASTCKQKTCLPTFSESGGTVSNFTKTNKILFNSSNLDLYDFTTSSTYFTATFDIIGTGATTLDLNVQIMTGTEATSYDDVFDYPEIKLARYDVIHNDLFTMTSSGQVTPEIVPTVPTTVPTTQPTTAVPTTVPTTQPTTAVPTTVPTTQPTTTVPTTVPTTQPVSYAATLYVAAPVFREGTKWDELYLAYSSSSNVSTVTKLPMTKTDNIYYLSGDVAGSLAVNINLDVYKIDLTEAQVKAIDSSSYAGFTNKNANYRTNYIWANSVFRANVDATGYTNTKRTISELNGKIFVINDAANTTNKSAFLGNWISQSGSPVYTTIYSASPVANDTTSMGDMYFRYGTNSTVSAATQIKMEKTDYLYTNTVSSATLKAGQWAVYRLELTESQAKSIDACNYTGFTSAYGAAIRTNFTYGNSVARAKVDSYSATYNTAKTTMNNLNDKMFFITASVAANTSSYLGYWGNYNADIKTISIKVAAPVSVKGKAFDSMNLVYSNTSDIDSVESIKMNLINEAFTPDNVYTNVIDKNTDWAVYEVELTADQFNAINKSSRVGFASNDKKIRTCYNYGNNVFRAGVGSYLSTYNDVAASIESLNGSTFVICGAVSNNLFSFNGYWK